MRENIAHTATLVLGDGEVAVEVKSTDNVQHRHLNGMKQFAKEFNPKKFYVVSNDKYIRKIDNITVLPWNEFLKQLWGGEVM